MTPSLGIEAILTAEGVAGGSPWLISISRFRTEPDMQVCIIDLPGRSPEVLIAQDYPGIQVLVRGSRSGDGYTAAWDKARDVFNALQAIPTPHASWPELASCVARHNPGPVGYDPEGRPIMTLNFDLIVAPEDLGHRIY
jgi:hypothetical protein